MFQKLESEVQAVGRAVLPLGGSRAGSFLLLPAPGLSSHPEVAVVSLPPPPFLRLLPCLCLCSSVSYEDTCPWIEAPGPSGTISSQEPYLIVSAKTSSPNKVPGMTLGALTIQPTTVGLGGDAGACGSPVSPRQATPQLRLGVLGLCSSDRETRAHREERSPAGPCPRNARGFPHLLPQPCRQQKPGTTCFANTDTEAPSALQADQRQVLSYIWQQNQCETMI